MNKLSIVALALVMGCGILGVDDEVGPLTFEIRDTNEFGGQPSLGVIVSTQRMFDCEQRLNALLGFGRSALRVSVYGIATSGQSCQGSSGPAQYRGNLGDLPNGSFRLEIQRGVLIDAYTVTVTDTEIAVATIRSRFTSPAATQFPRSN